MPHVASAFDIYQRLEEKNRRLLSLEAALDIADSGALILDRSGDILFANRPARDILCTSDGLTAAHNKLVINDSSASKAFGRILEKMFGGSLETQWSWGGDVYVPRSSTGQGYSISVRCLPDIPQDPTRHDGGAAVVFITDPRSRISLAKAPLITAFNLTQAEAEVALAFVNLGSATKIAESRQVSLLTIRTQLKHIMHKLNVHNQAELMRFLLSFSHPNSHVLPAIST